MNTFINLYSVKEKEIEKFLKNFSTLDTAHIKKTLEWKKEYKNPIEMADIIAAFIDNSEKYDITMWISLDNGCLINITNHNANDIIKYLYERYPY